MQYDRFYLFNEMETLLQDLEQRTGRAMYRKPQNVTGRGQGRFVDKAHALGPRQLETLGPISREPFWTEELCAKVQGHFKPDYEILTQHTQDK